MPQPAALHPALSIPRFWRGEIAPGASAAEKSLALSRLLGFFRAPVAHYQYRNVLIPYTISTAAPAQDYWKPLTTPSPVSTSPAGNSNG
jgi:hypothetical protein